MRLVNLCFIFAIISTTTPLCADIVKLRDKPPFEQVTILEYSDGRLAFRGLSKYVIRRPIGQVEWMAIDGANDFNDAENAVGAGDWDAACASYQLAERQTSLAWLADLIGARRIQALAQAGRFDEAVRLWLDELRAGRRPENLPPPRKPAPPNSERNKLALQMLNSARPDRSASAAVRRLRLELLIYEDASVLPREFIPTRHEPPPEPASADEDGAPPLVFGQRPVQRAAETVLLEDSFLLDAAREAVDKSDFPRAARILERALSFSGPRPPIAWLALRERCRIEIGDVELAVVRLQTLVNELPGDAIRNEALYYLALAHERAKQASLARKACRELLASESLDPRLADMARQTLLRLGD